MALNPGDSIGPYRVVEQIGRGGMATVYKARHEGLERDVAIKVLPDFLAEQADFRERFQQEAVAVAHLRHPSILAVHDYGTQDGLTYIVNEYVSGGTLADRMGRPHSVADTVQLLGPIASALDYAHARGVIHRDVKPSNILFTEDGTPILADFGLARMLTSEGTRLTMTGMIVGTPDYMAPEQCAGDEVGPPADVYALGIVAYQMLTGQLPFTATTPAAVLLAQMQKELPPPRSFNPELEESASEVLVKVLAKAPADRYATAGEFVGALARSPEAESMAQGPVTVVAPPPSPPPSYAPPTPPPSYAPPPAAYTPPPTFYPPASAAAPVPVTPTWVLVLLGVGGVVSLVLGGLFLLYLFSPDADTRNGALLLGVPLVILAVLHGLALFGLAQRHSWARGMGFVAAVFLCLTCVGVVIGAPLIYGLVRTRTAD